MHVCVCFALLVTLYRSNTCNVFAAPINMPVEVRVERVDGHTIHAVWRGVSTTSVEEPLEGYKVR